MLCAAPAAISISQEMPNTHIHRPPYTSVSAIHIRQRHHIASAPSSAAGARAIAATALCIYVLICSFCMFSAIVCCNQSCLCLSRATLPALLALPPAARAPAGPASQACQSELYAQSQAVESPTHMESQRCNLAAQTACCGPFSAPPACRCACAHAVCMPLSRPWALPCSSSRDLRGIYKQLPAVRHPRSRGADRRGMARW